MKTKQRGGPEEITAAGAILSYVGTTIPARLLPPRVEKILVAQRFLRGAARAVTLFLRGCREDFWGGEVLRWRNMVNAGYGGFCDGYGCGVINSHRENGTCILMQEMYTCIFM